MIKVYDGKKEYHITTYSNAEEAGEKSIKLGNSTYISVGEKDEPDATPAYIRKGVHGQKQYILTSALNVYHITLVTHLGEFIRECTSHDPFFPWFLPFEIKYVDGFGEDLTYGWLDQNDTAVRLPELVNRDGFTFEGWYSDKALTTRVSGPIIIGLSRYEDTWIYLDPDNKSPIFYAKYGAELPFMI